MKRWTINLIYMTAYIVMLPMIVWRRISAGRSFGNPWQRVLGRVPRIGSEQPVVWLHAVSVGEVNQLDAIMRQLAQLRPDWRVVISTTTVTGMELVRKKHPDIASFWFPIDFSWAMSNALTRINPCMIVLTELEVWPNLIEIADRRKVPVAVINGRLSEKSFGGYQRLLFVVRPVFSRLAMVITQDNVYAQRFTALGADSARVHVAGSIKYDNAARQAVAIRSDRDSRRAEFEKWVGLQPGEVLLVAGSTQVPEEQMLAKAWRELQTEFPFLRLAIVPRHPHRSAAIAGELDAMGIDVVRRSTAGPQGQLSIRTANSPAPILLVDTIGELGYCWALSEIAFVGGSFGNRGGQNMLEPAAAGNAVCFGPNTWNFATIVADMTNANACTMVNNEKTLADFIRSCLTDPGLRKDLGQRARRFVADSTGATERTVQLLTTLGPEPSGQKDFMAARVA